jgi:hypothetical protein
LQLGLPEAIRNQISSHIETIKTETLATEVAFVESQTPNFDLDGVPIFVELVH